MNSLTDSALPQAAEAPLIWQNEAFALYADRVEQGPHVARALSATELTSGYQGPGAPHPTGHWQPTLPIADFPQYHSDYPLTDALYNLTLEEAYRAVEPDNTLRTGQEWAGVWTRDVSYSILLAQAIVHPQAAKTSLLRKVSSAGRIVQDTGTGGAYPCSTDRLIWAVAAWEVYLVTGDEAWARQIYPIIKNSLEDDWQNVYDAQTGLVRGESSFLDWREQTYPRWMQPADIYQSENLGTNAVHFQANQVLALLADRLGETAVAYQARQQAEQIKLGINQHLWQEEKGYYGQFLYGRTFPTRSPRAEALGEALSVLYGIADTDRAKTVVARTPTTAYGVPCIYPQIPGVPPYHNNAVWPFVQSFWTLAAARAGHEQAMLASMAAVYRPAALFLTNKENFVAQDGDFAGTQVNSNNMLWSLSGSLGLVYKGLFGMDFQPDGLVFRPFVPQALRGHRVLTGFRYRGMVLTIELHGFGSQIAHVTLDGQPLPCATVPGTLTGPHTLVVQLANQPIAPSSPAAHAENAFAPETPTVTYAASRLQWPPVAGATTYQVLRNGQPVVRTADTSFAVPPALYAEYQVVAVDAQGLESFASEPLPVAAQPAQRVALVPRTASRGALADGTGADFVEISKTVNTHLAFSVPVAEAGRYALSFHYANGNGPLNTDNRCAFRTLRLGPHRLGTVVLPQRGADNWTDWGFSNPVLVSLTPGTHPFTLAFEPTNENMHGEVNHAHLDYLRVTRIA